MKLLKAHFPLFALPLAGVVASLIWIQAPLARAAGDAFFFSPSPGNNPGSFDNVPMEVASSYPLAFVLNGVPSTPIPAAFTITPTGTALSDAERAAGYGITITRDPAYPNEPTQFTANGETLHFIVTGKFPLRSVSTTYSYTVSMANPAGGSFFTSHFISATSVPPPPSSTPPTVTIAKPDALYEYAKPADVPATLPLEFTGTAYDGALIKEADATANGTRVLPLNYETPRSPLTATGTFPIVNSGAGSVRFYEVRVNVTDTSGRVGTATKLVEVRIGTPDGQEPPPPAIAIQTPGDGNTFSRAYADLDDQGRAPIPLTFLATASAQAPISKTTWAVDGGTPVEQTHSPGKVSVNGSGTMLVKAGGPPTGASHTVVATATVKTSGGSTTISDTHRFNVIVTDAPPPVVTITTPVASPAYKFASGASITVPFTFTAQSNAAAKGGRIRSLTASIRNSSSTFSQSINLAGVPVNLATVTVSGANAIPLSLPGAGTYTIDIATADDFGSDTDTLTFSVVVVDVAPTILVTRLSNMATTYSSSSGLSGTQVFNLTGNATATDVDFEVKTSTHEDFKVDDVVIWKGTSAMGVTNLGHTPALGTAFAITTTGRLPALAGSAAGTDYLLTATGKSAGKTVSTTVTIRVVAATPPPVTPKTVAGLVYFDANVSHDHEAGEPGIEQVCVELRTAGNTLVCATKTGADGRYSFLNVAQGCYHVVVIPPTGFIASTPTELSVTVDNANITSLETGLSLHFAAIRGLTADGRSHGFWKSNISKANDGKTGGVQVSATLVNTYTSRLRTFALAPFSDLTPEGAEKILSGKSQLELQLLASEYNYAHGATDNRSYIGGSAALTSAFLHWGEHILSSIQADPWSYSPAYVNFAKDWFDAYNNSYGGKVVGPLP